MCNNTHTKTENILIQSPANGHLSYFCLGYCVNSDAMNTGVNVPFWIRDCFFHMYTQEWVCRS